MVETSLINLDDAIQDGLKLSAGSKVILPSGDEAEIYGFISTENDMLSSIIDMPPMGECQVFSNRVIFYMKKELHRFPIFSTVCKASQTRYDLHLLYIVSFFNSYSSWDLKAYIKYMESKSIITNLRRLKGVKIEENLAYYYPNDYDLYFESRSKLRAIGVGFAVVIRRISKLSDEIKYELFDAHSVRIERNEEM